MLTTAERSSSSESSHFPVIIGSRWSASCLLGSSNGSAADSHIHTGHDYDVQPPTVNLIHVYAMLDVRSGTKPLLCWHGFCIFWMSLWMDDVM